MPSLNVIFSHWWKTAIELFCFSPSQKSCIGLNVRQYHLLITYTDTKMTVVPILFWLKSTAELFVMRVWASETSLDRQQETWGFWRAAIFRQGLSSIRAQVSRTLQIWHLQAGQWKSVGGLNPRPFNFTIDYRLKYTERKEQKKLSWPRQQHLHATRDSYSLYHCHSSAHLRPFPEAVRVLQRLEAKQMKSG